MKNFKILRNVKIVFWIIILIIIGLLGYQNKAFFMAKHSLGLKLPFLSIVHTPELSNAVLFLIFFIAGFLIAYFLSMLLFTCWGISQSGFPQFSELGWI